MPHKDKRALAAYMRSYNQRPHAKAKATAYHTRRNRRAKLRLIAAMGGQCTDCGWTGHPAAFHFDHKDSCTKEANVGNRLGGSWDNILAEAAKCDLVCANCHAIRTWPDAASVTV